MSKNKKYSGLPCLFKGGCKEVAVKKGRCAQHQIHYKPFTSSDRKSRLPNNWNSLRKIVMQRDKGVCYFCGEAGADGVDHVIAGDDHSLQNLKAIHHWVENSRGEKCHFIKTSREQAEQKQNNKIQRPGSYWAEQFLINQKKEEKLKKEKIMKETPTTRYLIIAAGDATRWGNYMGVPKHMIEILGEPIIHRTQRILERLRQPLDEIVLVVKDKKVQKEYVKPGLENSVYVEEAILTPEFGDADKILSSQHLWNNTGRTVIIWGDCFLSEAALEAIVRATPEEFVAISRWGANKYTGAVGGENFAHVLWKEGHEKYSKAIERVVRLYKEGKIPRNGGWEIYKSFQGLKDNEIFKRLDKKGSTWNPKLDNSFEVIDGSEDFDAPKDWDNWCYNYAKASDKIKAFMEKGEWI